jgi:hypothetical protein
MIETLGFTLVSLLEAECRDASAHPGQGRGPRGLPESGSTRLLTAPLIRPTGSLFGPDPGSFFPAGSADLRGGTMPSPCGNRLSAMDRCYLLLMRHYDDTGHINVGSGDEVSIANLADVVRLDRVFATTIVHDDSKPDGRPRKELDVSRLHALGWRTATPLAEGIATTHTWFLEHEANRRDGRESAPGHDTDMRHA